MKNCGMNKLMEVIDLDPFENEESIPSDFNATLTYLVYSIGSANQERNANMFFDYYFTEATLREVGEKYGLSPERARQIISYIERRLRTPRRRRCLEVGLRAYCTSKVEEIKKKSYEEGYAKAAEESLSSDERRMEKLNNTDLYEADSSVRLYNALYRAGYTNIGSIIQAGAKEIIKVRNLGRKSYEELVEILVTKYGADRSEWTVAE